MTEAKSDIFPYLPHTDANRQAMLAEIGSNSIEELISLIPKEIRAKDLNLPDGLSELELAERLSFLAGKNKPASQQACFLGGGSYRRFVPAIVPAITSRSEFATAYTPYQAEVSQGTLQIIYEFQTAICLLTGMDVANASIYDGPTACAEAALMACRLTGRNQILVSQAVNSEYAQVTETYVKAADFDFSYLAINNGETVLSSGSISDKTAAIIVQYPNFYGLVENLSDLEQMAHKAGALLIVVSDPISLGFLTPPGQYKADIVVGDAQQCGNFLSFGGPSAGYIASRTEFVRQLPGRLAGMTKDNQGRRAFTLALQTREQHIRRAKATSNICTNQALNTLAMLVYLTAMGPSGLKQIGLLSMQRAHYLAEHLIQIKGVEKVFNGSFFNEFAIKTNKSSALVLDQLLKKGILGGIDLSTSKPAIENGILIAVTEMNNRIELDHYVQSLTEILGQKDDNCETGRSSSVSLLRFEKTSPGVK